MGDLLNLVGLPKGIVLYGMPLVKVVRLFEQPTTPNDAGTTVEIRLTVGGWMDEPAVEVGG